MVVPSTKPTTPYSATPQPLGHPLGTRTLLLNIIERLSALENRLDDFDQRLHRITRLQEASRHGDYDGPYPYK